jgi:hypothetical protein
MAMDELTLGGAIAILSSLPGLAMGAALLTGKWRPASLDRAPHPDRVRVATGAYLLAVAGLVLALGLCLLVISPAQVLAMVPYAIAAVVGVSVLGMIPLLRAIRP